MDDKSMCEIRKRYLKMISYYFNDYFSSSESTCSTGFSSFIFELLIYYITTSDRKFGRRVSIVLRTNN